LRIEYRSSRCQGAWGMLHAAFHGMALMCHIEGSMIHLRMFLNSKFYHFMFKCWILLKPVLVGVDGSLHFTVSSMNRPNQTEPATFSILPCWAFFGDSYFLYFWFTETLQSCMFLFIIFVYNDNCFWQSLLFAIKVV
jgi:hypothetical protein